MSAPRPRGRVSEARARLLRTASALFYAEGIHAVGVDRVIVAGRRHPGHLLPALPEQGRPGRGLPARRRPGHPRGGRRRRPASRGCAGSIGAMARDGLRARGSAAARSSTPPPSSPTRRAPCTGRSPRTGPGWRDLFRTDLATVGHPDPSGAAAHLMMLRDGAMVAGYLADPEQARATLGRGLDAILAEAR